MKRNILKIILLTIPFVISCWGNPSNNDGVSEMINDGRYKAAADLILQNGEINLKESNVMNVALFFSERAAYHVSIPLLRVLLVKYPENASAKLLLANNLRQQKEFNEALAIYNEIVQIDSIRFVVLPERARLFTHLEEFPKAENDIAEAKMLQPKYFASFLADGLLQYAQGRQQEALDLFDIAEDLDPGFSSESSLNAGYILLKNSLNYDAIGKFTRAIEVHKNINVGYAFINRGVCQINMQDTVFACQDWDSGYYYMPEQAKTYIDNYCMDF